MAQIDLQQDGGSLILRFAGLPDGCMTMATVNELAAALDRAERDDGVRVLIFAGAMPGIFIRHYSVAELAGLAADLRRRGMRFSVERPAPERGLPALARRIEELPKPTIAAINGLCLGGGLELALACDLRIIERGDFEIGLPEVKIGLLPGGGGTQKLSRLIGMARALDMILRGRTISPAAAVEAGLGQELADDALERALEIGWELAARPAKALAHIKRLVRESQGAPDQGALGRERTLFLDLAVTDEAVELMGRMLASGGDIREQGSFLRD